jgi:hypothetical protein
MTPEPSRADLQKRLAELRREYEAGIDAMTEIARRQEELRHRLLRISGAIQVLEELLGETSPGMPSGAGAASAGTSADTGAG